MTDITRVYINSNNPHYEVGVWGNSGMIRNEWFFDLVSADDRRDYLQSCYIKDSQRRIHRVINIGMNQDAEYSAEWALYGEAETLKSTERFSTRPDYATPDWRIISVVHAFVFNADLVTYRRFPLVDAARIEAQ